MDFDRTYDTSEVAELCHVTRRTVYNWITSGLLKAEKVGPRRWIVRGAFLKTFLERGGIKPAATQKTATPVPAAARTAAPTPASVSPAPSLMQSRPGGAVAAKKKKPRR
jgi:excisionase family DNA binding protein